MCHCSQAEQALRMGYNQVKSETENGKHRTVPLSMEARKMFEERIGVTERDNRLFIRNNEKTHQAVNRVGEFLQYHRKKCETEEGKMRRGYKDETNFFTYHRLRYNYVQERIQQEVEKGLNFNQAACHLSKNSWS